MSVFVRPFACVRWSSSFVVGRVPVLLSSVRGSARSLRALARLRPLFFAFLRSSAFSSFAVCSRSGSLFSWFAVAMIQGGYLRDGFCLSRVRVGVFRFPASRSGLSVRVRVPARVLLAVVAPRWSFRPRSVFSKLFVFRPRFWLFRSVLFVSAHPPLLFLLCFSFFFFRSFWGSFRPRSAFSKSSALASALSGAPPRFAPLCSLSRTSRPSFFRAFGRYAPRGTRPLLSCLSVAAWGLFVPRC